MKTMARLYDTRSDNHLTPLHAPSSIPLSDAYLLCYLVYTLTFGSRQIALCGPHARDSRVKVLRVYFAINAG